MCVIVLAVASIFIESELTVVCAGIHRQCKAVLVALQVFDVVGIGRQYAAGFYIQRIFIKQEDTFRFLVPVEQCASD